MPTLKLSASACFLLFFTLNLFPQIYNPAENYGGKEQLREFIKETLFYPEKERDAKIEGTVTVGLRVLKDGRPENIRVLKSVSKGLDEEAVRIVSLLLWTPAESGGQNFEEEKKIEIDFDLKKYQRCIKTRGHDQIIYPHQPVDTSLKVYEKQQTTEKPKPIYSGGSKHFNEFIINNLAYPEAAIKQSISGTVELFFVVETSGLVSNIKIIQSIGAGCNEEAIRLLRLLKWQPGILHGMAVRTGMTLNITFKLDDYERHQYVPANNANQI